MNESTMIPLMLGVPIAMGMGFAVGGQKGVVTSLMYGSVFVTMWLMNGTGRV